jgi:hypothetical protein
MLSYCDYISHKIRNHLFGEAVVYGADRDPLVQTDGPLQYDLSETGVFVSTKKVFGLRDKNGKRYKITVEEA